jgi:translation initiation factor 2 gamma subunit (eIF-2gamma)
MIMKETSRLSAPGYALCSNAAEKTRKTGKESTLKNTVSCVDNPGHFTGLPG